MSISIRSIRPFLGARDFNLSREFYKAWGFTESVLGPDFSVFHLGNFSFYLQDCAVAEWIDNTQVFLEVENIEQAWKDISDRNLPGKFNGARLSDIRHFDWGSEFYLHDPSGILWHIGAFNTRSAT